ncbi:bifunctional aldolase/short-chain dehydrogenase [Catenuloplanes japonicus]|uniref:bifunctional aldolase/short-chain dehydrogenase n=1 Tax=Catenuloplanes japonicus TaxID=33876 RepID=UPI0005253298|nr:bifunctional aldolase/short-chain dehydrogenase [Catenuloplanes japonicus]
MITEPADRWDDAEADGLDPLAACVYASRLIGRDPGLVLHGGGNTSVKTREIDLDGTPIDVLHVKGSGGDLATIEPAGFAPLRLDLLRMLLTLDRLDDDAMMNALRCASLDASAPDPSVETLLHALLPHPVVLHSHADALLALGNQPDGAERIRAALGPDVLIAPYAKPGFDLAKLCAKLVTPGAYPRGLVLMHHGLFTFGPDARTAYRAHIALVTLAAAQLTTVTPEAVTPPVVAPAALARLRREISAAAGRPMLLSRHDDDRIRAFVTRPDLADVAGRGPATPDHVLRTRPLPLIGTDVAGWSEAYRGYVDAHRDRAAGLTPLDPAPRVLLAPELGMLTAGVRAADTIATADIYRHTMDVIDAAERLGGYRALSAPDLFDVEYWSLEQAKQRRRGTPPELAGEVALVTGAASGIGRACALALHARGAAVIGVDVSPAVAQVLPGPGYRGVVADVTDPDALAGALTVGAETFGGLDIMVAAAGIFPRSRPIAQLDRADWRRAMAVNTDAVADLFALAHPLLALAPRGGRVVLIASKNVPAPGPQAAPYSASKAAAVQLARVAAMEWAADGIRVNIVHPDAVFDTGLWTPELLAARAERYGMTVEQYKRRNLLGTEVTSARVGALTATLCTDAFAATTGTQVSVDGGNDRVI